MVDWKVIFLNPSRRRHEITNGLKSSKINIILVYTFLFGWSFENKNKNRNTGEREKIHVILVVQDIEAACIDWLFVSHY